MMIRRLQPNDFSDVWELGQRYIDARLKPDMKKASKNFMYVLSSRINLAEGMFEGDRLVGVVMASSHEHAYATKSYAVMQVWIGAVGLLERAIEWWEGRHALRFLSLQFPMDVRPGLYRMLRQRGFERTGDMNMLWR